MRSVSTGACEKTGAEALRWVGDPVDVVTGAVTDVSMDFVLAGELPLTWRRHADSTTVTSSYGCGHGQDHEYNEILAFDLDGLCWTLPLGEQVFFPMLVRDGQSVRRSGALLKRISSHVFEIHRGIEPRRCFVFEVGRHAAPLVSLRSGIDRGFDFAYDARGLLSAIRDAKGRGLIVEHDGAGRVLKVDLDDPARSERRTALEYRYDGSGNLVTLLDSYGNRQSFEYDHFHRIVRRGDRNGYSFRFEYDTHGRCIRATGEDGVLEARLQYLDGCTRVTRGNGGLWSYHFDTNGAVTHITDPLGGVRAFPTDAKGRVAAEIDPLGRKFEWVYGVEGAYLGRRTPEGLFEHVGRRAPIPHDHFVASRPIEWELGRMHDPSEFALGTWSEEALGYLPQPVRLILRSSSFDLHRRPLGVSATRAESMGLRRDDESQPLVPLVRQIRDDFGLLVRELHANGGERRFVHDACGNVRRSVDRDGARREYEYASWNHLVRTMDGAGGGATYAYSSAEEVTSVTDACGVTSEFAYDLKDRLVEVKRHGVVKERYTYDAGDRLVSVIDGLGNRLAELVPGPHGLPIVRKLAGGEDEAFVYDSSGRVLSMESGGSKTTFAYDVDSGLRTLDQRDGLGVAHEFDPAGRLRSTTVLGRFRIAYRRAPGKLVIEDPTGSTRVIESKGRGLFARRAPNGTEEWTQFDREGRVLFRVKMPTNGSETQQQRFTYSLEGDLLESEDGRRGRTRYEYDAAHRLVGLRREQGQPETWTYDRAGNLQRVPLNGAAMSYDQNRLVGVAHDSSLSTAGRESIEYDHRNHVRRRTNLTGSTEFEHDARGRLVAIRSNSIAWRATYDPFGRRATKTVGDSSTTFYWDTDRLAAEIGPTGAVRVYVYADHEAMSPIAVVDYDSIEAKPSQGRSYTVYHDQRSTPVTIEDLSGRHVWAATFEPYGKARIDRGSIDFGLRFPGHYFDPETGLHYNRFRYYDPVVARYLESDPIGLGGGLNLYAYTPNPLTQVDVRGLACPPADTKRAELEIEDPELREVARQVLVERHKLQRRSAAPDDDAGHIANNVGMKPETLENLRQYSKEEERIVIVRASNIEGVQHYGRQDCVPKGGEVKLKTAKSGPNAGLVVLDNDVLRYHNEIRSKPDYECEERRQRAGESDADFEARQSRIDNWMSLQSKGYTHDAENRLVDPNGKFIYGDHDLQGVYDRPTDRSTPPEKVDMNEAAEQQDVNQRVCPDDPMFWHGANDNSMDDSAPKGAARTPGAQEVYLVTMPDGSVHQINSTRDLQTFYKEQGIKWPYEADFGGGL